jgi:hypothetical protein
MTADTTGRDPRWIVGTFSRRDGDALTAYAAGYPEEQDLLLTDTAICDPRTGEFVLDGEGRVQLRGIGVLIRWDQVAYLEFIEA